MCYHNFISYFNSTKYTCFGADVEISVSRSVAFDRVVKTNI
jgi:hypothetical protein